MCKARKYEQICASCQGVCALPEEGKPVISIGTARGFDYLSVGWAKVKCRYKESVNFDRLLSRSALTSRQRECSFRSYRAENGELMSAQKKAMEAARNGSNLILAWKWGTGKTHLAIAIAPNAMNG